MDIKNLPQRKSIRLKNYDYSSAGLYFITICTDSKKHRFGKIKNNDIILNEYGQIAYNEWIELKNRFKNIKLHEFIVMPNHIHGIIEIFVVGTTLAVVPTNNNQIAVVPTNNNQIAVVPTNNNQIAVDKNIRAEASSAPAPTKLDNIDKQNITLSNIVGAYKSLVANKCLNIYKSKNEIMGKFWQRNYYENIIKNEEAYIKISEYIKNNPKKWQEKYH